MEYERKSTVNHLKQHRDPTSRDTAAQETKWTNLQTSKSFIQVSPNAGDPVWTEASEFLAWAFKEDLNNEIFINRCRIAYERNKSVSEFSTYVNKLVEPQESENVPSPSLG